MCRHQGDLQGRPADARVQLEGTGSAADGGPETDTNYGPFGSPRISGCWLQQGGRTVLSALHASSALTLTGSVCRILTRASYSSRIVSGHVKWRGSSLRDGVTVANGSRAVAVRRFNLWLRRQLKPDRCVLLRSCQPALILLSRFDNPGHHARVWRLGRVGRVHWPTYPTKEPIHKGSGDDDRATCDLPAVSPSMLCGARHDCEFAGADCPPARRTSVVKIEFHPTL